ncbi:hypothetical protein SBA2_450145 [Acidobacteriia bacterium SbA2]|nr:hypothetical protein SBA2_450145 [Acidobacteriia bacterium SbA2]
MPTLSWWPFSGTRKSWSTGPKPVSCLRTSWPSAGNWPNTTEPVILSKVKDDGRSERCSDLRSTAEILRFAQDDRLVLSWFNKHNPNGLRKGGALAPPPMGVALEGPLGPETKALQGLKPRIYVPRSTAGLKPRPSGSNE